MTVMKRTTAAGLAIAALAGVACGSITLFPETPGASTSSAPAAETQSPGSAPAFALSASPDEPVFVSGDIPFTSRFFLSSFQEPFVLLEDEAGYVKRDRQFEFALSDQHIGPVEQTGDNKAHYSLDLPSEPQGTFVDVDNNGKADRGVQIYAIAYWSNIWGGPFLERRDGTGWSNAYTSALVDSTKEDAIVGGTLLVWAPDDQQQFPTGLGDDGILFTADDPAGPIPTGCNIVDMGQKPFHIYKEAQPKIDLNEGVAALNDYSSMSRKDTFEALFKKISTVYPFTRDKNIDWDALHAKYAARVDAAVSADDYYLAIRDFMFEVPDNHIAVLPPRNLLSKIVLGQYGGGYGLLLRELSDGQVVVSTLIDGLPAQKAGITQGAEIVEWDGKPIKDAISAQQPRLISSYSTDHTRRQSQVRLLARAPIGTTVKVSFKNPGGGAQEASLTAGEDPETLTIVLQNEGLAATAADSLGLPVEGKVLPSGMGYIKVGDFLGDQNLIARLWDHYIQQLVANNVPALVIDLRNNGGGNGALAVDFAGYFFDKEVPLWRRSHYNEGTGQFEADKAMTNIKPGPSLYQGPIAVLVSSDCGSACEGFAYALQQEGRSIVVGYTPTAGAFGSVGAGQVSLPDGISLQFPTDRPENEDGTLVIEGTGVVPDITVPVTENSLTGKNDEVLDAAVKALKDKLPAQP